jgi:hypothetical protein
MKSESVEKKRENKVERCDERRKSKSDDPESRLKLLRGENTKNFDLGYIFQFLREKNSEGE